LNVNINTSEAIEEEGKRMRGYDFTRGEIQGGLSGLQGTKII
jgi:hypothetical protein